MRKLINTLKKAFVNGLLVVLPLGFTVYILWLVYRFINSITGRGSYFGGLISGLLVSTIGRRWFPGIGVILTVLLVFLIGLATRIYVGRKIYDLVDRAIQATPLINKMYDTVKQIINAVFNRKLSSFREVVMFEYPRKDVHAIGFVTNEKMERISKQLDEDVIAVFVFTTPNPLSGLILLVPRKDLTFLDINIEEGLRLVLSLGIFIPEEMLEDKIVYPGD